MAQKLKFGNGTWATKEGSTLAYNDENNNYKPLPFTTTRNSIATRVNKQGLIEVVGNDVPRIDYTDSAEGALLLEPSRTNLITDSQTFTGSTSQVNRESNSTDIKDPFGTNTAFKFTVLTSGADANTRITNSISITNFSVSIYVNGLAGQKFELFLARDNYSQIFSTQEVLSGGWQRIELNGTFSTASTTVVIGLEFGFTSNDSVAGQEYYLTGLQLEQGSYPTSYIPTSGSSITRQADTANGSGNSEVFNDSEGVLFADIAALANDGTSRQISISNGGTTERVYFGFRANANEFILSSRDSSYLIANISDVTNFNKYAFQYKSGSFKAFINGFDYDLTLDGGLLPTGLNTLNFDSGAGNQNFYGKTKEIGYYDEIITDLELEYLTSYRSLNELVTELNLNTL